MPRKYNLQHPRKLKDPSVRFWRKVDKNGPIIYQALGPCWIWTARVNEHGYGTMEFKRDKKRQFVHRFSWTMHFGRLSDEICVLHRCDNPPCVNPDHLFLGTQTDNMSDMYKKGRQAHLYRKGMVSPNAKFTYTDALKIRELYSYGTSCKKLAELYKVSNSCITRVLANKTFTVAPNE